MSVISNNTLAGSSGQGGSGYEIERSLRFNDADSSYLTRTPSSAGSLTTWTWSAWVKNVAGAQTLPCLFGGGTSSNRFFVRHENVTDVWEIFCDPPNGASTERYSTIAAFRDYSAWAHYVLVWDTTNATPADRCRFYVNGNLQPLDGSFNQNLQSSVNNNIEQQIGKEPGYTRHWDGYLADVHFIDGQALAATDFGEYDDNNVWQPKEYGGTYGTNGYHLDFSDTSSNAALGTDSSGNSNTWTVNNLSVGAAAVDYSAMMTNVNAGAIGNAFSDSTPNTGAVVGSWGTGSGTTTFTPTGGIAVSSSLVVYYGAYDNNARTATLTITYNDTTTETDTFTSGQNNWMGSFTASNAAGKTIQSISVAATGGYQMFGGFVVDGTALLNSAAVITDALRDSPVNGDSANDTGAGGEITGNYATLNPLHKGATTTLSNGNLDLVNAGSWATTVSTIGVSSGKWYAEVTLSGTLTYPAFGVSTLDHAYTSSYFGQQANSFVWFAYSGGGLFTSNAYSNQASAWNLDHAAGDVFGLALDMDNGTLKYYKNGTLVGGGNAFTGITGTQFFATCGYSQTENWNFGQRAFAYTAPSGYKALCTANLPDPTIADGSTAFDTKTFTANNGTQTISGFNFSPDLVWTKSRANAYEHQLWDQVRGENKALMPNATSVEANLSGSLAFTSDGFTSNTNNNANYGSGGSVAWAWDAGSSNTTIAAGSLNSSAYNQSQTWSSGSTSGSIFSGNFGQVFNGVITNTYSDGNSAYVYQNSATYTFPSAITGTIEVWIKAASNGASGDNVTVTDGTTVYSTGDITNQTAAYVSLNNGNSISGITSITLNSGGSSQSGIVLGAIKLNGKMLVDSGVTPPNFPSIASTVRANPSAGFSIVSYTGNGGNTAKTVGHGLNATPEFIIIKSRDSTTGWEVFHGTQPGKLFYLHDTSAAQTSAAFGTPDSNTITVADTWINATGDDLIAYCFAPVEGYSAFGSYVGNGLANGPFVYTGFKPQWLMIKRTDSALDWCIFDKARDGYNGNNDSLYPNASNYENSYVLANELDILSNGFKAVANRDRINTSAGNYIYVAFASHPFKTSRAR